jgi:hypothetical protein
MMGKSTSKGLLSVSRSWSFSMIGGQTCFLLARKETPANVSIRGSTKFKLISFRSQSVNIRGREGAVDVGELDHIVRTGLVAGLAIAVDDFNAAKDSFSFDFDSGSFDSADFKTINGAALTDSNFDADLKADIGSQLHANSAVLLHISGGEFAGDSFLVVDGNGQAGYQAGSDYVVELTNINGTITAADIHA